MLYLIISFLIALYENIRKMVTIMNLKEEFIRIYTENIKREGAKELLTMASPGECIFSLNNNVTAMKFEIADFEKVFAFT